MRISLKGHERKILKKFLTFTKIGIFEITLKSAKKIRELFLSTSRVFTLINLSKRK